MLICCEECPKLYNSISGLYHHVKKVHEGIIYRCEKCDYYSGRKQALSVHINAKHDGVAFICDQCNQTFKYKPDLTSHKKFKHEGISFDCKQCGLKIRKKSELEKHKRSVHEGYKTKHEGQRYSCNLCSDEEFSRRHELKVHTKKVHKGLRHPCTECGHAFVRLFNLKRHVKSKHANEGVGYKCTICTDKIFTSKQSFQENKKVKHEIE